MCLPYILAYKSQNLRQNLDLKVGGASQLRISGHADATPSSPLHGDWPALTLVNHRDDAVDGGPCIHLNNRPVEFIISEVCIQYKSSKATCDLYVGQ